MRWKLTPESMSVSVTDDGCGSDIAANSRGHGSSGLERRAEGLKARVDIDSERGVGTKAVVVLEV